MSLTRTEQAQTCVKAPLPVPGFAKYNFLNAHPPVRGLSLRFSVLCCPASPPTLKYLPLSCFKHSCISKCPVSKYCMLKVTMQLFSLTPVIGIAAFCIKTCCSTRQIYFGETAACWKGVVQHNSNKNRASNFSCTTNFSNQVKTPDMTQLVLQPVFALTHLESDVAERRVEREAVVECVQVITVERDVVQVLEVDLHLTARLQLDEVRFQFDHIHVGIHTDGLVLLLLLRRSLFVARLLFDDHASGVRGRGVQDGGGDRVPGGRAARYHFGRVVVVVHRSARAPASRAGLLRAVAKGRFAQTLLQHLEHLCNKNVRGSCDFCKTRTSFFSKYLVTTTKVGPCTQQSANARSNEGAPSSPRKTRAVHL